MGSRLELHDLLLEYSDNVYYQPPSTINMKYPCIVYNKSGKDILYADNKKYRNIQNYHLTVIDRDPDSKIADRLESDIVGCVVSQYYTVDNLNHTTLNLYY